MSLSEHPPPSSIVPPLSNCASLDTLRSRSTTTTMESPICLGTHSRPHRPSHFNLPLSSPRRGTTLSSSELAEHHHPISPRLESSRSSHVRLRSRQPATHPSRLFLHSSCSRAKTHHLLLSPKLPPQRRIATPSSSFP